MSLPKQYSLMYAPILNFLADGAPHKRKEIKDSLIAVFSLTLEEQIMQTGGRGKGIFDTKVNDALFYLIKTGMVEHNDTTIFKITDIGMNLSNMKLRVIDDETLTKHGNGFRILSKQQEPGKRPEPVMQKTVHEKIFLPSRPNAAPQKSQTAAPVKKDLDFRKVINTSRQGPWRQKVERFTAAYSEKMSPEESDAIKRITKNKDKNIPLGSEDVKTLYLLFEKLHAQDPKSLLSVLCIDEKGHDIVTDANGPDLT